MITFFKPAVFSLLFTCSVLSADAFTHHKLPVKFLEYEAKSLALAKKSDKPVFMLFSAEWCYWCKVFEEEAMQDEQVTKYLSENYINVFVDADIRSDLLMTFGVTLLPYVVFLKPDGTIFSKYGGTLGVEDFLELIKIVRKDVKSGKSPIQEGGWAEGYTPPEKLDPEKLKSFGKDFVDTAFDGFDMEEYGLGGGPKTFMPLTFLYLMGHGDKDSKKESLDFAKATMEKATDNIYDPYEGGFFRYAETRGWNIPHFEKMVDTNAAAILMALKVNADAPSGKLREAAKNTIGYMSSKLYDEGIGSFMSFQEADELYYRGDMDRRKMSDQPVIVKKIFTDRLAIALIYLLDAFPYLNDAAFKKKIESSVAFLAAMAETEGEIYHYYSIKDSKWSVSGKLSDYASLSLLFSKAYTVLKKDRYLKLAKHTLENTSKRFYSAKSKIFYEKNPLKTIGEIEKLLELNAMVILAWQETPELEPDAKHQEIVEGVMTYFSGLGEILTEKAWGAKDLRFLEKYGRFLTAVDNYLAISSK